ncbi:MAG: FeoB small GTPase domain-containing protein [Syntrophomonadaceae bacterium]|nr:FeoB small GTPase domain-containing protein [Syntrophomonadaceae bacterium]MDD3898675.1 FeoB small GTPase domain-containing protein [Syntrophomonadaceae bacterium]MDD4562746.1 FeoB small GTPase domain-containing protein [Syntrophomonadaceae bacterium]
MIKTNSLPVHGQETTKNFVIALAGNPNVGKSTVFNRLTGLNQHTGNWPGKTVIKAEGAFSHRNRRYTLVDLPGTYSLHASSTDEQVARDFICFSRPDLTLVVCDATCLERNLNLVLQILEITDRVVLCVNLLDEAERKGIYVDTAMLSQQLGIPVVGTAARSGRGLTRLKDVLDDMVAGKIVTTPRQVVYDPELETSINELEERLTPYLPDWINSRWVALRILERDYSILDHITCTRLGSYPRQVVKEEVALCLT